MEGEKVLVKLVGLDEPVLMTRCKRNFWGFRSQPETTKPHVDLVRRLKKASISNFFYATKPRTPVAYMEFIICNPVHPQSVFGFGESSLRRTQSQNDNNVDVDSSAREKNKKMKGKMVHRPDDPVQPRSVFEHGESSRRPSQSQSRVIRQKSDDDDDDDEDEDYYYDYDYFTERSRRRGGIVIRDENDNGRKRKSVDDSSLREKNNKKMKGKMVPGPDKNENDKGKRKMPNFRVEKNKKKIVEGPDPAPAIPKTTMDEILRKGCVGEPRLILQKKLFASDLKKNESRLSIPINQLEDTEFLHEHEKARAGNRLANNRIEGLRVEVIEPRRKTVTMILRRWKLNHSSSYMLTNTWQSVVVPRNEIKEGHILQIYFFRDGNGNPCFALVNLSDPLSR